MKNKEVSRSSPPSFEGTGQSVCGHSDSNQSDFPGK